jgi:hypothetical protein
LVRNNPVQDFACGLEVLTAFSFWGRIMWKRFHQERRQSDTTRQILETPPLPGTQCRHDMLIQTRHQALATARGSASNLAPLRNIISEVSDFVKPFRFPWG